MIVCPSPFALTRTVPPRLDGRAVVLDRDRPLERDRVAVLHVLPHLLRLCRWNRLEVGAEAERDVGADRDVADVAARGGRRVRAAVALLQRRALDADRHRVRPVPEGLAGAVVQCDGEPRLVLLREVREVVESSDLDPVHLDHRGHVRAAAVVLVAPARTSGRRCRRAGRPGPGSSSRRRRVARPFRMPATRSTAASSSATTCSRPGSGWLRRRPALRPRSHRYSQKPLVRVVEVRQRFPVDRGSCDRDRGERDRAEEEHESLPHRGILEQRAGCHNPGRRARLAGLPDIVSHNDEQAGTSSRGRGRRCHAGGYLARERAGAALRHLFDRWIRTLRRRRPGEAGSAVALQRLRSPPTATRSARFRATSGRSSSARSRTSGWERSRRRPGRERRRSRPTCARACTGILVRPSRSSVC